MAGILAIVTAEILPIGLLLPIAAELGVTPGVSGAMLVVWMAVLTVSNLISAIATDYWMILAARVPVGVVIGGFWSIGAGLAGRLVAEGSVARATSTIFLAVPLGSVLGVPLGTYIADVAGWRNAFVMLTALSGAVLIALVCTVPALPAADVTRVSVLGRLLRVRDVRIGLVVAFLVVLAHFGTYTYVSAFLADVTGLGLGSVSALLLVYGAAGLVGNVPTRPRRC